MFLKHDLKNLNILSVKTHPYTLTIANVLAPSVAQGMQLLVRLVHLFVSNFKLELSIFIVLASSCI